MNKKYHLLVIDDDDKIRLLLSKYLSEHSFAVSMAKDTQEARHFMANFIFDLIILDVMMPGETGIDFAKILKEQKNQTPILMLTALGEVENKIEGLEAGVDDYLAKPFEPKELLLRIKNILKRTNQNAMKKTSKDIRFETLTFDIEKQLLFNKERETIKLTTTEKDLLTLFAKHPGEILTREELGKYFNTPDNLRTIDVQITRLRKKIENNTKTPKYLRTIRNKGYQLIPD